MEDSTAIVTKHNFEAAKGNIQRFSRSLPSNPSFQKVATDGGLFGWSDHKVTGEELNKFTDKVQSRFIALNSSLRDVVKEFNEVYNALDALDKDYIQAIIIAVTEAKDSGKKALEAQENIGKTIDALKITVENLKDLRFRVSTIDEKFQALDTMYSRAEELYHSLEDKFNPQEVQLVHDQLVQLRQNVDNLQLFISTLESLEHLSHIDESWVKLGEIEKHIHQSIEDFSCLSNKVSSISGNVEAEFVKLNSFVTAVKSLNHLFDIDSVWSSIQEHSAQISGLKVDLCNLQSVIEKQIAEAEVKIEGLTAFQKDISSIQHLHDVDSMWESMELHATQISTLVSDFENFSVESKKIIIEINENLQGLAIFRNDVESICHLHDIDRMWQDIQQLKSEIQSTQQELLSLSSHVDSAVMNLNVKISELLSFMQNESKVLNKKIIIAYVIGGIAGITSLAQLILILLNII